MIIIKEYISDPTIVSGILSMMGGIIGGFTAYSAAIWQTRKHQKSENEKRNLQEKRKIILDLKSLLDLLNNVDLLLERVSEAVKSFRMATGRGTFQKDKILSGDIINEINLLILQIKQNLNLLEFYEIDIKEDGSLIDDLFKDLMKLLESQEKIKRMDVKDKTYFLSHSNIIGDKDFDEQWNIIVENFEKTIQSSIKRTRDLLNKLSKA